VTFHLEHLSWCGSHPFVTSKTECLQRRGLLRPDVWHQLHVLATEPAASATALAGYPSRRMEVVNKGVVMILTDHLSCGLPVLLTAFIPHDPRYGAGHIAVAASKIREADCVSLRDRLWGLA